MATKKRRLWTAGCWFIYCRVSRAIKAPSWDGKTIYTAVGEGGQRPGPMLLTAQNGERVGEVLGPADLDSGFRWKLRTPVYPEDRKSR